VNREDFRIALEHCLEGGAGHEEQQAVVAAARQDLELLSLLLAEVRLEAGLASLNLDASVYAGRVVAALTRKGLSRRFALAVRQRLGGDGPDFPVSRAATARGRGPLASRRSRRGVAGGSRPHHGRTLLVAAAMLLLAAGAFVLFGREQEPLRTARIVSAEGQAKVLRGGSSLTAAEGTVLLPGDRIETGPGGRASLRYGNGTVVELNEATDLALGPGGGRLELRLGRGDIYVRAAGAMAVNVGQCDEASVLGTEFELSRRVAETVLRTAGGTVRFGTGSSAVAVGRLQASRVAVGGAPEAPKPITLAGIAAWRNGVNRGLVGYWKFDEGAGATAEDSSGRGHAGILSGGAKWVAGKVGGAVGLDGVDGTMLRGNVSGLAKGNAPHTVAAWIKVNALPSYRAWILQLGDEGSGSHHWLINSEGGTQFGVWGGWPAVGQLQPDLPLGQWKHVAVTFDGTTEARSAVGQPPSTCRGFR
jgi:ferric-dicitrate binding protein FerR (iron transport regulator)